MRYLLDTNTYFALLAEPPYFERHRDVLERIAPRTHLSSVVQFELMQGALGEVNRARVGRLLARFVRTGRVVAPTADDWLRAAVGQSRLWDRRPATRSKRLQNDLLIAATARQIGALVVTDNLRDFELVRLVIPHRFLSLAQLGAVLET